MTTSTNERIFEGLADRHEAQLEGISGRVRYDIGHGERTDRWMVKINHGDVQVSRDGGEADSVVRVSREVFEQLASGELNAPAALLRGDIIVDGDLQLAALLQRLFPKPPRRWLPRPSTPPTPTPDSTSGAGAQTGAGHITPKGQSTVDSPVKILDGNTFVVSETSGDIEAGASDPAGLFSIDTRFLSHWVLTVNGQRLSTLSIDDVHYFESRFFLVPGSATVYTDAKLAVIRTRIVCNGFHEELTILNHDDKPVDLTIRINAGSDFADIFEVKDALAKKGTYYTRPERGRLVLGYRRDTYHRFTDISTSSPAEFDSQGLTIHTRIGAHGQWTCEVQVDARTSGFGGLPIRTGHGWGSASDRSAGTMQRNLERWVAEAPKLECDWDPLERTYRRSLVDLAALRFSPNIAGELSLPAAGLPWFMSMFGRDSIFTSLQALPFAPELAATTLAVLGSLQGTGVNDFREEEPGRILHENRTGEMTAFEERPHSPYYGSADATALFVVLLDEYERWTGDTNLVCQLETEARAALGWIDEYADLTGRGYVSYQRRNEAWVPQILAPLGSSAG